MNVNLNLLWKIFYENDISVLWIVQNTEKILIFHWQYLKGNSNTGIEIYKNHVFIMQIDFFSQLNEPRCYRLKTTRVAAWDVHGLKSVQIILKSSGVQFNFFNFFWFFSNRYEFQIESKFHIWLKRVRSLSIMWIDSLSNFSFYPFNCLQTEFWTRFLLIFRLFLYFCCQREEKWIN